MKNKEFNKLVWKIFLKRKWNEIKIPLAVISLISIGLLLFYFIGKIVLNIKFIYELYYNQNGNALRFFDFIVVGAMVFMILSIIGFIIYCFIDWLHDNWKESVKEAKRLNRKKK